jgi:hypothetical protein
MENFSPEDLLVKIAALEAELNEARQINREQAAELAATRISRDRARDRARRLFTSRISRNQAAGKCNELKHRPLLTPLF